MDSSSHIHISKLASELGILGKNVKNIQEEISKYILVIIENRNKLIELEIHQKSTISNPIDDELKNIKSSLSRLEKHLIRLENELHKKSRNEE